MIVSASPSLASQLHLDQDRVRRVLLEPDSRNQAKYALANEALRIGDEGTAHEVLHRLLKDFVSENGPDRYGYPGDRYGAAIPGFILLLAGTKLGPVPSRAQAAQIAKVGDDGEATSALREAFVWARMELLPWTARLSEAASDSLRKGVELAAWRMRSVEAILSRCDAPEWRWETGRFTGALARLGKLPLAEQIGRLDTDLSLDRYAVAAISPTYRLLRDWERGEISTRRVLQRYEWPAVLNTRAGLLLDRMELVGIGDVEEPLRLAVRSVHILPNGYSVRTLARAAKIAGDVQLLSRAVGWLKARGLSLHEEAA